MYDVLMFRGALMFFCFLFLFWQWVLPCSTHWSETVYVAWADFKLTFLLPASALSAIVTDMGHHASGLVFKWQCLSKRKIVIHKDIREILSMFMARSCCQLQLFHLIALCYLIKTLMWVGGCWFKTSLRFVKINCRFVLQAPCFIWAY